MCRLSNLNLCYVVITVVIFSGTDLHARGGGFIQQGRKAIRSPGKTIKRQTGNAAKSARNMGNRASKSAKKKSNGAIRQGQKVAKRTQAKGKSVTGSITKNAKSTASKAQKRTQPVTKQVKNTMNKLPTSTAPKPLDAVRKPVSLPKLNSVFGSNSTKLGNGGFAGPLKGAKPGHQATTPVNMRSKLPRVPKVPRVMTERLNQRQAGIEGVPGLSSNGKTNGGNGTTNTSGSGPTVGAGGYSVPVPKGTPFLDPKGTDDNDDRPNMPAPVLGDS